MSSDLSEFHESFFEESFEAVESMESALLELDHDAPDGESVNGIFRGAHSIKGGAGMFGFEAIAGFTHVMETLLDEIRNGQRRVDSAIVDLLLQAVDCLRAMLAANQAGEDPTSERVTETQKALEAVLAGNAPDQATDEPCTPEGDGEGAVTREPGDGRGWRVRFRPHPDFFASGNDPLTFLKELGQLGPAEVECRTDDLPDLDGIDAGTCYLSWTIDLRADVAREAIDEVFGWVEDQAEIEIEPVAAGPDTPTTASAEPGGAPPTTQGALPADTVPAEAAARPNGGEEAPGRGGAKARTDSKPQTGSIRVAIDKIDTLINLVGELVITQSMLSHLGEEFDESQLEALRLGLSNLDRHTRELQESVMSIRMLPIKFCFSRFPRVVHDLSSRLGKRVELELRGEQTELDKTVLEKINDPLVHAVRNCIDHGIELPEARRAAGKPETGHICLNAYHSGGNIVIEVTDDGAGLPKQKILERARERGLIAEDARLSDEEIDNLVFLPGFSTAERVSDISGRGVGMDVVRRNINDLGGSVEIHSLEGQGSTLTIRLPLTMAILDGQLVRVGDQIYVIAVASIVESLRIEPHHVSTVAGENELYRLRESYIPILRLYEEFGIPPRTERLEEGILVVVEADGRPVGLFVDELLGQQQVVIKSLEPNYRQLPGIAGATILGDGRIALILDVPGLTVRIRQIETKPQGDSRAA